MKKLFIIFVTLFCSQLLASNIKIGSFDSENLFSFKEKQDVEIYGTYIEDSRVENYDKTSLFEFGLDSEMKYFHDILGGDIDARFLWDMTFFMGSADIDLPNQVSAMYFDVFWNYNSSKKYGFLIDLRPGMYSEFDDFSGFYLPFSLAVTRFVNKNFSMILGLDIRPGFDRTLMPRIGFHWQPTDILKINLQLPESICELKFDNIRFYGLFAWNNMSYDLDAGDNSGRDQMTIEDFRLAIGTQFVISDDININIDLGKSYNRSFKFETHGDDLDFDVDDGYYCKVSVGTFF